MQIKRTMTWYCKSIRMVQIWNTDNTNAGECVEKQKFSFIVGGNAKSTAILGHSLEIPYKTRHSLTI